MSTYNISTSFDAQPSRNSHSSHIWSTMDEAIAELDSTEQHWLYNGGEIISRTDNCLIVHNGDQQITYEIIESL